MKSINNNLTLLKHAGYQVQLTPTNQVVLFHPRHPVCSTQFPELDERDRVVCDEWDWMPEPVEAKVKAILLKARSLPTLPRGGAARALALQNPFAEPGTDYCKNWEEFSAPTKRRRQPEVREVEEAA